ncbi:hypothetical protein BJY52DRAFT_1307128 [Lactarius psammicola]|nr:hypothetical protein BJY52DRAFT_1307128 [Lactarius psammicola]
MADAFIGLMNRTLSSNLTTQSTKESRTKNYIGAMAELSLPINRRTLGRVLYGDWGGLLDSVEFGLLLRNARYSDPFAMYYSQCVVSVIIARVKERDDPWFELTTGQLDISKSTLEKYLAHGDSMLLANCVFICRRTLEAYSQHRWHHDVYSRSNTLELVSRFDVQDTLPELQHKFCFLWNELVRNTGDRRSRNLSIYILKHIRKVYFGLHLDTIAVPTAFTDKTPDDDIILVFPSSYPSCKIGRHHPNPSSAKVDDVCVEKSEEPLPDDAPPILQDLTPVAAPIHTPLVIPANSGSQRLPPGLPSPKPFSVTQGGARTHSTSFGPGVTPHTTYISLSPPSNMLSRIRDHHTKAASNISDVTSGATTRAVHTLTPPCFAPHLTAVLDTVAPLTTHDASSMLTSDTGHTSAISADMLSVGDVSAVSPQPISFTPPARAVVRTSHVKDDPRPSGPLANMIVGTTLAPASSKDSADTPSPSRATNDSIAVLPRQQQSAPFVPATTPDLSQPLRDTRPSPEDTD